jgi:hypothetical protein
MPLGGGVEIGGGPSGGALDDVVWGGLNEANKVETLRAQLKLTVQQLGILHEKLKVQPDGSLKVTTDLHVASGHDLITD